MKNSIKEGFGYTVGVILGMVVSGSLMNAFCKLTNKECPKTEKKPESGDSQE